MPCADVCRNKLSKLEWKYIIIDEAQRMKDRESKLSQVRAAVPVLLGVDMAELGVDCLTVCRLAAWIVESLLHCHAGL